MPNRAQRFIASLADYRRPFWVANVSELFERIAFYGTTSMLVLYLTRTGGLGEGEAVRLNSLFGMLVYGLPVLSGMIADVLGYRRALLLAYSLLAAGYFLLSQLSGYWPIAGALLVVACGASLVKPTITGTVQKTCGAAQRAVGFSIYYTLVNVGGFLGPQAAGRVTKAFGGGTNFILCGAFALIALALVAVLFRQPAGAGPVEHKTVAAFGRDFLRVVSNRRLVALIVLVAGFWLMFFSLYGVFPLYLTQQLGADEADVGNLLSIESFGVILLTVFVGNLTKSLAASRAFMIGVLLAAVGMAVIGAYPSLIVVALGVFIIALGEITYSAHFYKYLGDMAPPDQVGMYMGFAFLPIALGYFASGWVGSGLRAMTTAEPRLVWFGFAAVGLVAAAGLFLLTEVFKAKRAAAEAETPVAAL